MKFFKHRDTGPSWDSEVTGLAELAESRGWQPVKEDPFSPRLRDIVQRLHWPLDGRRYPGALLRPAATPSIPLYSNAYRGSYEDRGVVVANCAVNIGSRTIKQYEMVNTAVCAVELGSLSPIMLLQTAQQPPVERFPTTPTGNPEFDDRFSLALSPGLDSQVITPELQQRLMAHEDWAFAGDQYWLACVSRGSFRSAEDVTHRLDEMMSVISAFPTSVVPTHIDRSADDLAARIRALSSPQDVVGFLSQLSPEDRQRLAESDTPLAP